MNVQPSEDQTVLPPTLLDDVDTGGSDATVVVDDRVAAFTADERASTVLDAAEAATLLGSGGHYPLRP